MMIRILNLILIATVAVSMLGCDGEVAKSTYETNHADSGPHYTVKITKADFQNDVLENPQVVMVDFWAPWCKPCLALGPTIEELAQEYEGKAVIGKFNTDEYENTFQEFGLPGIPALLFFKDGKEVDRIIGVKPKKFIAEKLDRLLRG